MTNIICDSAAPRPSMFKVMGVFRALTDFIKPGWIILWGILAALSLIACAARPGLERSVPWRCDPAADAAFERGDWQAALNAHEQLLAADPDNCLAAYHLGYIVGHMGDRSREVALYQRALACGYSRDDQLYFNLGMALADLGRLEDAHKALQTAVSLNPGSPDNHFGLGLTAQTAGRSDAAVAAFERAVSLSPDYWEARLSLARLYLDQGRWDHAARQIDAVLQADPANEEALELLELLRAREAMQYD